jgi:6,7-dimethyl-8-ribityllumazine synthase
MAIQLHKPASARDSLCCCGVSNTMVQTTHTSHPATDTAGTRIAFIQSSWHTDIVNQGRDTFLAEMQTLGTPADSIDIFKVPGAFEIPLHAQKLARSWTTVCRCSRWC